MGFLKISFVFGLLVGLSSNVFGMEYVSEFWEKYRQRSCTEAKEAANARVSTQLQSGSDIYEGPISKYKGKKIIRFIKSEQGCEPLWSEGLGMVYDYALRIQIEN